MSRTGNWIIIIIIIITRTMFMVLSSWHSHCESSPGSFDECRLSARWTGRLNPDTVTHPSTNWARRRLTSFVETNVLLLYQTTTIWWPPSSSHKCRTAQTLRPRQPTRAASPPEWCYHALVKSLTRCYCIHSGDISKHSCFSDLFRTSSWHSSGPSNSSFLLRPL